MTECSMLYVFIIIKNLKTITVSYIKIKFSIGFFYLLWRFCYSFLETRIFSIRNSTRFCYSSFYRFLLSPIKYLSLSQSQNAQSTVKPSSICYEDQFHFSLLISSFPFSLDYFSFLLDSK